MSDDTKAALNAAISAHFADEFDGSTALEWLLISYGSHYATGAGHYLRAWAPGQPLHHTGGLLDYAVHRHAILTEETLNAESDDDE